MSLGKVSARFLAGVAAWLLGAGAATGGSLLAVSVLGQGLAPAPSQQLTVAAVNRALASEAAEAGQPSPPRPAVSASATPLPPRARKSAATPSPRPQPSATLLASAGGTVLAGCQAAGAYLDSWSPAQGYEVTRVIRGPAAAAKVTFTSSRKLVTMVISCPGGVPAASTAVTSWGGDD